jgi:hypothetical protein
MKKYFWVLICLAGLAASSAQAVLYRYEPFNYTTNTGLRTAPGYTVSGGDPFTTNRAGNLTYEPLLPSVGGKAQIPGHRGMTGFGGNINYAWITNLVPASQPVFASILLNVAAVGTLQSNSYIFSPRNNFSALAITNHPGGKYKIGLSQGSGVHPVWSDNSGAGYDTGTTYFVVISYTNTGGVATNMGGQLWVNPATGLGTPPAAQISMIGRYSTASNFTMNFGNGNGSQTGHSTIYVDEVRIGSTWVDVTPSGVKPYPVLTDAGVLPSRTNIIFTGNTQDVFFAVKNANGAPASNVTVKITSAPAGFSANNATNTEYGLLATDQTKTNTTAIGVVAPLSGATLGTPYSFSFDISGVSSNVTYTTNGTFAVILKQSVTVSGQDENNKFFMAANTNLVTTNSLMTISNSSDRVLVCTLTESAPWLTLPGGTTLTIAPRSASNVVMVAGPVATEQQLTTPLTVAYDHTVTNFQNFTVQFDVGPKIEPLVATPVIAEISGVTNFPGLYEPGENLNITITSTNNGAVTVNNITNTLTGPAGFLISPASAVYSSMTVGSRTSTTYQVSILGGTPEGTYTFTARNSADGKSWSGTFTLDVYNRAIPAVTPTNITLTMPANGTATATIMLTNSGNKATTFALSDSGVWNVNYLVSTQTALMVYFPPTYARPDTNNTFTTWSGDDTALMNFGFSFPFYSTNYNSFSVSRFGAIGFGTSVGANTATPPALPFGASPLAAAFWGNNAVDTNSVRYEKQADKLVVAWGNRTGQEFQAWIYTNGQIRYLYEQAAWSGGVIGVQQTATANQTVNYNPGKGSQSVLLTRQVNAWVTPDMTNGTLNGLSSQAITFTANAAGQAAGTNVFNVTVTWGDGSSSMIAVTTIIAPLGGPCNITFTNKLPAQLAVKPFSTTNLPIVLQNSGYIATNVTSYLTANPAYGSWLTVNSGIITNLSIIGSTNATGLVTNLFNIATTTNAPTGTFPDAFVLSVAGIGSDGSTNTYSTDISLTVVPTVFASINKTRLFALTTNGTDTAVLTVSNTAGWALSYNLSSPDAWLSYPSGTLNLASNSFTNITLTANATLTSGVGSYDGTLTVSQLNNTTPPIELSMLFEVGNRALPSVTPTNLVITVPRNSIATTNITLSNAGNVSVAFALSDSGAWAVNYLVSTQTALMVYFPPTYATPDTNNTFTSWIVDDTALMNLGFNFPFYGTNYSSFSVSRYGAIGLGTNVDANTQFPPALPSTNIVIIGTVTNRSVRPAIAPFWGATAVATDSVRYEKQADKLVVAWGNRTGHEFQAWVYTNGQIRYLYEQATWIDGAIGVQLTTNTSQTVSYSPGKGSQSVLLTPQVIPWVTPDVTTGTVNPSGSQVITFTANATNQATGTNNFNVTVTWGNGIIQTIPVRVIVTSPNPGISVPPSVTFSGLAGDITVTNMMIVNTGNVAVAYSITDTGAQTNGYSWTNTTFSWDNSAWDDTSINAGELFDGDDKTAWLPISFPFTFYGNVYTQFLIDVNGGIVLSLNPLIALSPFSSASVTLDDNSTLRYSGTQNQLVVTWENSGENDQTFQAIISKNGIIRFQYQTLSGDWPGSYNLIMDTTNRFLIASLLNETTTVTTTNIIRTITNMAFNTPQYLVTTNITVSNNATIRSQAIRFTPKNPIVLSVEPVSGILPVGGTNIIKIIGDARSLTSGGTNNVNVNTIFGVNHPGSGLVTSVVSGVTNIAPPNVVKPVSVLFRATNSMEAGFSTLDSDEDGMSDRTEALAGTDEFNADSVFGMGVVQNTDGSRTVSWPKADDNLSRTYTVRYTTDLMGEWTVLYSNDNFYSYTDSAHADVPVIYYQVIVSPPAQ